MLKLKRPLNKWLLPTLLFFFLFFSYVLTNGGHGDSFDGIAHFLISENFVLTGSPSINVNSTSAEKLGFNVEDYITMKASIQAWDIYMEHKGEVAPDLSMSEYRKQFSFYDIRNPYLEELNWQKFFGPAYLVLPILISPIYFIAQNLTNDVTSFVFLFSNSLIISFVGVLVFFISRNIFKSESISLILAVTFGLSSFIWPYTTTLFARPLAILFLLLSLYLMLKKTNSVFLLTLAGLSLGISSIAHYNFILLIPPVALFGIFHWKNSRKKLLVFFIGLAISLILLGYITNFINGSPYDFGYFKTLDPEEMEKNIVNRVEGLYGFLFSSGNSIFIYLPVALLTPFGFYYFYKNNRKLALLFLTLISIVYFQQGLEPNWNQNPYWGPHRYLLTAIPFLLIPLGSLFLRFSNCVKFYITFGILAIIGFFINLLGNLVWIMYAYAYGWGPEGLWKLENIPDVFTWSPYHSPISQMIKILQTDWVSTLPLKEEAVGYFKIGLNGCAVDLFIYCELGIGVFISLLSIVVALALLIIFVLYPNRFFNQDIETKHS